MSTDLIAPKIAARCLVPSRFAPILFFDLLQQERWLGRERVLGFVGGVADSL
jgi:hypothetical protein